jgi:hypothetical protein
MDRSITFNNLKTHPWLSKAFIKLSKQEIQIATEFIHSNQLLSKGDFEFAVNRMFLDQANKPKNYSIILELLTCCNSALPGQ